MIFGTYSRKGVLVQAPSILTKSAASSDAGPKDRAQTVAQGVVLRRRVKSKNGASEYNPL